MAMSTQSENVGRKKAIMVVIAFALPPERGVRSSENKNFLLGIAGQFLELKNGGIITQGLLPFVGTTNSPLSEARRGEVQGFVDVIQGGGQVPLLCAEFIAYLLRCGRYNARGRTCAHNFGILLGLSREMVLGLEGEISRILRVCSKSSKDPNQTTNRKEGSNSVWRYAKIGAVAAGTGALVAFTAGLAAPAIAAGLALTGGLAGVASLATATIVGTLFGISSGGLAGYKMARRTKGLSEFAFEAVEAETDESCTSRLALAILVSGTIRDVGDQRRMFGFPPAEEDMTLYERLLRFYRNTLPDRAQPHIVAEETRRWDRTDDSRKEYLAALEDGFECSPCELANLVSPPLTVTFPDNHVMRACEGPVRAMLTRVSLPPPSSPIVDPDTESDACSCKEKEGSSPERSSQRSGKGRWSISTGLSDLHLSTRSIFSFGKKNGAAALKDSVRKSSDTSAPLYDKEMKKEGTGGKGNDFAIMREKDDVLSDAVHGEEESDLLSSIEALDSNLRERQEEEEEEEEAGDGESPPEMPTPSSAAGKSDTVSAAKSIPIFDWRRLGLSRDQSTGLAESQSTSADVLLQRCANTFEPYVLRWELRLQQDVGKNVERLMAALGDAVLQQVVATTVFAALAAAVALPAFLIKLTDLIDGAWTLAIERADVAGIELAKALASRAHGNRAVTLVGHSLGCRVVFSCLVHLEDMARELEQNEDEGEGKGDGATGNHQQQQQQSGVDLGLEPTTAMTAAVLGADTAGSVGAPGDAAVTMAWDETRPAPEPTVNDLSTKEDPLTASELRDIVQSVYLFGAALGVDVDRWKRARAAVSGRFVNGFSANDLVLALIFRYERWKVSVAGVAGVDIEGVEDVDLSSIVQGHSDYSCCMEEILTFVNFH